MRSAKIHTDHLWQTQVEALRASLIHMPEGPYRRFSAWVLNDPDLAARWLQVTDVTALMWMTTKLLRQAIQDSGAELTPHIVAMNVYLMYENVSDNLAIGLARPAPDDHTCHLRRTVLHRFNQTMIAHIRDPHLGEMVCFPKEARMAAEQISLHRQSLAAREHGALADAYLAVHGGESLHGLENDVLAPLHANIETAAALVRRTGGSTAFHNGLIARYAAVEDLLAGRSSDVDTLVDVGTDTILVVPTLAYYADFLAERVYRLPGYRPAVDDGTVERAFREAALLVRLLNDAGTLPLEQSEAERGKLHASLVRAARQGDADAAGVLEWAATLHRPLLTRIAKDLRFGEFNVCLDGVLDQRDPVTAVDCFVARLEYLSGIYHKTRAALLGTMAQLSRRLGHYVIPDMVGRFVEFHRLLYAQPYDSLTGDYAVAAPERESGVRRP